MEINNNTLQIEIPEGMTIDTENSDLAKGIIKFKNKPLDTLSDVLVKAKTLDETSLRVAKIVENEQYCQSDLKIKEQANFLIAYTKLMMVADVLNDGWRPILGISNGYQESCYCIMKDAYNKYVPTNRLRTSRFLGDVIFRDKETAQKAIDLMGDELDYIFNYRKTISMHNGL